MKKARFTETQIIGILKEADTGTPVKEICRSHGISDATDYNWKPRYGGMSASDLKRLKEMERELSQLKRGMLQKLQTLEMMLAALSFMGLTPHYHSPLEKLRGDGLSLCHYRKFLFAREEATAATFWKTASRSKASKSCARRTGFNWEASCCRRAARRLPDTSTGSLPETESFPRTRASNAGAWRSRSNLRIA